MAHFTLLPTPHNLSGSFSPGSNPGAKPHGRGNTGELLLGRRILLAEDEAMLAYDIELALEEAGAEVVGPALSLDDALAFAQGEADIDAAILDVDLRGKDVFPVASLLMARGVPFLFHTGHGTPTALTALFPGSIVCIKPTTSDTLVAKLRALIAGRASG